MNHNYVPFFNTETQVPDAVACINQLAALGTVSCSAVFGGASNFCTIGNAQIVGITGVSPGTSSYW